MFNRFKKNKNGFTLVELLVTVAIFTIMTALVVAKYGNFSQSTLLTNLAYDVALTVRTAQTYGLSVKAQGTGESTSQFQYAYGVDFAYGTTDKFVLFVDSDSDGIYDGPAETISTYNLKNGAKIYPDCAGTDVACNTSLNNSGSRLTILFHRPDPEAIINVWNGSTFVGTFVYARIKVISSNGSESRYISVRRNGQISVDY